MAARLLLLIGVALSVHAFVTTIALTQEPASPGAAAAQIPPTQAPLAQAPSGPADVARAFAAAAIRHNYASAASYVTDKSRSDFLAVMDLSDRALKARADLQTAIDQKFKGQEARSLRIPVQTGAVLTAEVAAQRQITPNLVELDMRLYTNARTQPTTIVTWRAVHENGAWKIELPQCASPEAVAPLKARLAAMNDTAAKLTASVNAGEFASVDAARTALINAGRAPVTLPPS
jgi:hypothetical protein